MEKSVSIMHDVVFRCVIHLEIPSDELLGLWQGMRLGEEVIRSALERKLIIITQTIFLIFKKNIVEIFRNIKIYQKTFDVF